MYRETTRLRSFIALVFLFTYIAQSPCVLALRHPPVGNVCTAEEIANGQWVVHKPLTTLDEMRARYGLSSTAVTRCDPVGPKIQNPEGGPDYYDPDETLERTLAVASPELIPQSPGCKVLNPTRVQLIRRLLRSRNGLILVGDSLTEHQTQTIANFLHQSDELVHQEYSGIWGAKFWLNPDHPLTDSLLREAGVAPTRLTVPLVSFWRHHHLLDWSEKAVVWKDAGSRYKPDKGREDGPDWFSLMIDQAHGHDLIRNKHVLEEPTFMLLNTGAHFARFELGWNLTESDFAKAFEKTIKKVEDKVAGASIPISATWRTMAPGHIDCDIQSIHDNNRDHWKSPTDDKKVAHNYNWFHWMNAVYKGGRRSERPPNSFDFMSSRMTTKRNPEFMVMDVWPMSVKRPDAHMEPPHDCLHWCRTGVQNYWNTLLIHMMLAESRNKDYGV